MKIAGFDIGGANTDLAIISFDEKGETINMVTDFEYLPMWSNKENLKNVLLNLIQNNDQLSSIDAIGISMTAELVDAYETKKTGVLDIIKKVKDTFSVPIFFIGINGVLSYSELKENPLQIAAANWVSTARIVGKISSDCVFIDIGSTTTDIIPIKNGLECSKGRSDFERLATGELVYTGILRTNLATFIDEIPLKGNNYKVASELFAITADVYNILGKINLDDYICDTPDGAGKSIEESARRISRVLCTDLDVLSLGDVFEICKYIHEKQVKQVSQGLSQVLKRENLDLVITTGLGKDILGCLAAEDLNINVKSMDEFFTDEECVVTPAIGTAVLINDYFE